MNAATTQDESSETNNNTCGESDHRHFRSVLPHEPLPQTESGYVQIQGVLEWKIDENDDSAADSKENSNGSPGMECTAKTIESALFQSLGRDDDDDITLPGVSTRIPYPVRSVTVDPSLTKARLVYASPLQARNVTTFLRKFQITPYQLLHQNNIPNGNLKYGQKPLQATQITTTALPPTCWKKVTPPKFRRLIPKGGLDHVFGAAEKEMLEEQKRQTRYLFLTGVFPKDRKVEDDNALRDRIRVLIGPFDTSSHGIEVFLPSKKTKFGSSRYCYLGMRSHGDAEKVFETLQHRTMELTLDGKTLRTDRLFFDWADITHRSYKKLTPRVGPSLPSRSECTSVTRDVTVPGLVLVPDFLTEEEEASLIAVLTGPTAPWAPNQKRMSGDEFVKRRVQHYGYVFDYATADVLRDREREGAGCPPLPLMPDDESLVDVEPFIQKALQESRGWDVFAGVVQRVRNFSFDEQSTINRPLRFPSLNQITVNEYPPGQGIGSHIDTHSAFSDGLISITLNSGCVMEFRNGDTYKLQYLPPRSLLLMSGPSRYTYAHAIPNRKTDTVDGVIIPRKTRISLTLRTAITATHPTTPLPTLQSRNFPLEWTTPTLRSHIKTPPCESKHVHHVYDSIAEQWHHTRSKRGVLWPGATTFLTSLPPHSIVADVGCGDGKYIIPATSSGKYHIGMDISFPLLKLALRNEGLNQFHQTPELAVADCIRIPLRDDTADAAICIAVLHHISTVERRILCLRELKRIVRPRGTIMIQAWALEQQQTTTKRTFRNEDVFVPFRAQPRYLKSGDDKQGYEGAYDGVEYDEEKGLVVFQRYCHLYRRGELEDLVGRVGGLVVLESGYESGNYFVVLEVLE